jgi:hypothetical protein
LESFLKSQLGGLSLPIEDAEGKVAEAMAELQRLAPSPLDTQLQE